MHFKRGERTRTARGKCVKGKRAHGSYVSKVTECRMFSFYVCVRVCLCVCLCAYVYMHVYALVCNALSPNFTQYRGSPWAWLLLWFRQQGNKLHLQPIKPGLERTRSLINFTKPAGEYDSICRRGNWPRPFPAAGRKMGLGDKRLHFKWHFQKTRDSCRLVMTAGYSNIQT